MRARPYWTAAAAGTLYALGFPGIGVWPFSIVFAWPLLWLLDGPQLPMRRALLVGLVFGFTAQAIGYYWMPATVERFGALPWPLALIVSALLFALQAGQLGLWFLGLWRLRQLGREVLLWAPVVLAAVELCYPLLFPTYLANVVHGLWPVMQVAELGGPTLVSALWLSASCALYALLVRRRAGLAWRPRPSLGALVVVTLAIGWGAVRGGDLQGELAAAPQLTVGVVQANVAAEEKAVDETRSVASHVELSRQLELRHELDLLVWPETVLQRPLAQGERDLGARVPRLGTPLLTGTLAWGRDGAGNAGRLTNSAVLADADGHILGRYDKVELLPFVEHMPLDGWLPFLRRLSPATGRLSPGASVAPLTFGATRLGVLVCYEDLLPGFVRRMMREGNPQLLVNLTNDAWFGDTTEPAIHLALAQLRAVEQRRYLVRATNSGVSAIVDPLGRVVVATDTFERASFAGTVALLSDVTPYRVLGDWPGLLALLVLPAVVWRRRKVEHAGGALSSSIPDALP